MSFFNRLQKKVAKNNSSQTLNSAYKLSEERLKDAAKQGDNKKLKRAMSEHQTYEYALLYQKTPAYAKLKKRGKVV